MSDMLFDLKRDNVLRAYLDHPNHCEEAYAFAWYARLYPVFHENRGVEVWSDYFHIEQSFVREVITYLEELWDADETTSFRSLEQRFGGYRNYRLELRDVLRYCHIQEVFDDNFYNALRHAAPGEVVAFLNPFTIDEIWMT